MCPLNGTKKITKLLYVQALDLGARDAGDRFCIFSMRFSQDGDEILCGAKDGYIYLYDRGANRRSLKVLTIGRNERVSSNFIGLLNKTNHY